MGEPHRTRRPTMQEALEQIRTCHERIDGALATPRVCRLPGKLIVEWSAYSGDNCRRLRVVVIEGDTAVERIVGREYAGVCVVNPGQVENGRRNDLCSLVRAGIAWMLGEEEVKPC